MERAHQTSLGTEEFQQLPVVDVEAKRARRGMKVRAVDENRDAFLRMKIHGFRICLMLKMRQPVAAEVAGGYWSGACRASTLLSSNKYGNQYMANDSTGAMQELSALISEIEAEAYARGRSDTRKSNCWISSAREEKRAAPGGARRGRRPGAAAPKRRAGGSKRAPRGSVPRFVEQALRDNPGSTVQEILGLAATDAERLIRLSSIRVELGNGRKQGRYESRDGRWSLAASAPAAAGEDGSSGVPPEVEPERDDADGCVGRRTGIAGSPIPGVGSRRKREEGTGSARPGEALSKHRRWPGQGLLFPHVRERHMAGDRRGQAGAPAGVARRKSPPSIPGT